MLKPVENPFLGEVKPGLYRHYMNEHVYEVTGDAINKTHDQDGQLMVLFKATDTGKQYTRSVKEFCSVVIHNGKAVRRYEPVGDGPVAMRIKDVPFERKGEWLNNKLSP